MDVRQQAYIRLRDILDEIQKLTTESQALARKHKLVLVQRYLDAPPDTLDPKFMKNSHQFRDDLTDEECDELRKDNELGYLDDNDQLRGADIYDSWVPSSLC